VTSQLKKERLKKPFGGALVMRSRISQLEVPRAPRKTATGRSNLAFDPHAKQRAPLDNSRMTDVAFGDPSDGRAPGVAVACRTFPTITAPRGLPGAAFSRAHTGGEEKGI